MSVLINKKTLEYIAELSRIELDKKREGKMLNDLQNILGHFEELKEVNTEDVEPMAGGMVKKSVFREDSESLKFKVQSSKSTEAFPEKENDFLKVPPVFQNNE